jgi:hypothetical protein
VIYVAILSRALVGGNLTLESIFQYGVATEGFKVLGFLVVFGVCDSEKFFRSNYFETETSSLLGKYLSPAGYSRGVAHWIRKIIGILFNTRTTVC